MNQRIKYVRKNILKLSMEEFGEHIGISKSAVSQIESGTNNPSERTIKLICSKFGISDDWLRNGTEPMMREIGMDFGEIFAGIASNDEKAKIAIMKYYSLTTNEDKRLWWDFMYRYIIKDGGGD